MDYAGIAFFVYNRPYHTKQSIAALLKNECVSLSDLIIFSDGPKNEKNDVDVKKVRKFIHSIDKGFKSVSIVERDRNYGLANNMIDGINYVVNKYGKVIVVEDDTILHPGFILYMNTALNVYKKDEIVGGITGYLDPIQVNTSAIFFQRYPSCWGWATWKRSWDKFDINLRHSVLKIIENNEMHEFSFNGADLIVDQIENNLENDLFTYQIRWYASAFIHGMVFLHPSQSLIQNIGFDGTGDNCPNDNSLVNSNILNDEDKIPVTHIPLAESITIRKAYERYYNDALLEKSKIRKVLKLIKMNFLKFTKNRLSDIKRILKKYLYFAFRIMPETVLIILLTYYVKGKKLAMIYHSFGIDSYYYCIEKESFQKHIAVLRKLNAKFCSLDDYNKHSHDNDFKVLITFDDGFKSCIDSLDYLTINKIPSVLFLTTSFLDSQTQSYLSWSEIDKIAKNPIIEIGSHSINHMPMTALNLYDVENELNFSKKQIEEKLKLKINAFAYPYGDYNNEIQMISRKYYDYAFLSNDWNSFINNEKHSLSRLCLNKTHQSIKNFLAQILVFI